MTELSFKAGRDIRLAAYVRSVRGLPFEWGKTDCGSLAIRAIEAMYQTKLEIGRSKTALLRNDLFSVHELLTDLGGKQISEKYTKMCDIATEEDEDVPCIYIVLGSMLLTTDQKSGVHTIPHRGQLSELSIFRLP